MDIIPEEIKTALKQSYGYILLIKGKAGTGKTTFALELLKELENPIYISTRINPKYLYNQFPWIRDFLPGEQIIDSTTFDFKTPISFSDENAILQLVGLQKLPDFLRMLFAKMKSKPKGTVVIDSWDAIAALAEAKWAKSHLIILNYIMELVRNHNFNLILILETENESYLDYLVDGIICLNKGLFETDKLIRHVQILKLRGFHIQQPSYLFTLHNGRFLTFLPINLSELPIPKSISIVEDKAPRISTGILDFDKILNGGFSRGSVILGEIKPYLNYPHALFLMKTLFQFVSQKRALISVPPTGRDYFQLSMYTKKIIKNDSVVDQCFRILEMVPSKNPSPIYMQMNPDSYLSFFETIIKTAKDLEAADVNVPFFLPVSVDSLKFDVDALKKDIPKIISMLKKQGHIFYLTAMESNPLIDFIKIEADAHYVIDQVDGRPVFYTKNPRTNLFAINYDITAVNYDINLIPIE